MPEYYEMKINFKKQIYFLVVVDAILEVIAEASVFVVVDFVAVVDVVVDFVVDFVVVLIVDTFWVKADIIFFVVDVVLVDCWEMTGNFVSYCKASISLKEGVLKGPLVTITLQLLQFCVDVKATKHVKINSKSE